MNRELIALTWNCSYPYGVCRPRVIHIMAEFLLRTASEIGPKYWGYQLTVEAMLL